MGRRHNLFRLQNKFATPSRKFQVHLLKMMCPEEENIDDLFGDMDRNDRSEDEDDIDAEKAKFQENSNDEAEENNEAEVKKAKRKVGPKRVLTNPAPKLDGDRLCGRRGIFALHESCKDIKLNGKGYEKANLDLVMKKMEHWAYRLFPKMPFDDCIERVEKLGHKKPVQTYMKKIRMDMIDLDTMNTGKDVIEEDAGFTEQAEEQQAPIQDAFDDLLAHYSAKPLTTSSFSLTQQQQDKIAENKRRAEEKRKSRMNETVGSQILDTNTCLDNSTLNPKDKVCKENQTAEESDSNASNEELMDIDSILDDIPQD